MTCLTTGAASVRVRGMPIIGCIPAISLKWVRPFLSGTGSRPESGPKS